MVYSMAAFPFPQLAELREKYTYNITPFPAPIKASGRWVFWKDPRLPLNIRHALGSLRTGFPSFGVFQQGNLLTTLQTGPPGPE